MSFDLDVLKIDAEAEANRLIESITYTIGKKMRRRGGVVGISGGIDSSVVFSLMVKSLGKDRITALLLPDQDSDNESEPLANLLASQYGIETIKEDITPALSGFGAYDKRDEAIKRVFPEYDATQGYKAKLTLPNNITQNNMLNVFYLVIVTPDGQEKSKRLKPSDYFQIVAATNFKQRTRMSTLYYHAELRNYAVVGTANRNEHKQGFFVKYGDGGVDLQPILHLYKTQVYQLAEYLNVPKEIRQRMPTSDTYSAHQTQEEFFFRLPFEQMDMLWYALENNVPIEEVANVMDIPQDVIIRVFSDLSRREKTTNYLRMYPIQFYND